MVASPSEPPEPVGIVTGGSRGIGRAVAQALLAEGWLVHICSRSAGSVETAVDELEAMHGDRIAGRVVDVREPEQVDAFVQSVLDQHGHVDCLVNNAGLGIFAPIDQISLHDWHLVVRTNLDGCFYAMRSVVPAMKERGSGWIVNIASLASVNPFASGAAYNASKFGLLGLSDAAMLDLRQHGVRVTAILPGSVDTDFSTASDGAGWKLTAEDVARAVLDLLRYPDRALPSRLELRPSRPPK